MKIYIPDRQRQVTGGGWSFVANFCKKTDWAEFEDNPEKSEIYFIPGATMVQDKYEPERAKKAGAKIVLRVDNALKNSNNRGTGMSRMKKFSKLADLIIYQSKWARNYLLPFIEKDGPIIKNGVDHDIFNPDGAEMPNPENRDIYLYSRSGRDDQKGWHVAWYKYQDIQKRNPNAELWIIGKFSGENSKYNFDFFNKEKYRFFGLISSPEQMAMFYRTAKKLLYTFFNDACSNTLIEALSCGLEVEPDYTLRTGGAPEILQTYYKSGRKSLSAIRMVKEYEKEFKKL